MAGPGRERLVRLMLEQNHVFEPEHRAEMRRPRIVLALGDDLDELRSGFTENRIGHRGAEFADDHLRLRPEKNLLVEWQLLWLNRGEAEGFQRLDHLGPVDDVAAVGRAAADEDAGGHAPRGGAPSHILEDPTQGLAMLRMSVL